MAWLSVWSEVQMIYISSCRCQCYPIASCSSESRMVCLCGAAYPGCPGKKTTKRMY